MFNVIGSSTISKRFISVRLPRSLYGYRHGPCMKVRLLHESKYPSSEPHYKVAKISHDGSVSFGTLGIKDILKRLHARDLLSLALTTSHEENGKQRRQRKAPTAILPRHGNIVVSFGTIRAVISSTEGLLFDAYKPSVQLLAKEMGVIFKIHRHLQNLKKDDDDERYHSGSLMRNRIDTQTYIQRNKQDQDSFEYVFLEEILREVCLTYSRRLQLYEPIVDEIVTRVSNEIYAASGVHRLVPVKDSLQDFELEVKSTLNCLKELLEDDDDMLGLLLTEQLDAHQRGENLEHVRHESIELLLEEYSRQLVNILQEISSLLKKVQTKQDIVKISLDAFRNRVLRMNLYLSIAGVSIASSTAVAGFYGMNLVNGLEESPTAFWNLVSATSLTGIVFGVGCISYMSGSASTTRTLERLREIEVLDGALSPPTMSAIDYTMKGKFNNEKYEKLIIIPI